MVAICQAVIAPIDPVHDFGLVDKGDNRANGALHHPGARVSLPSAFDLSIFGAIVLACHYMITLAGIAGIMKVLSRPWTIRLILGIALLAQISDLLPLRNAVAATSRATFSNPLVSADWATVSKRHHHLVMFPAWQCGWEKFPADGSDADGLTTWHWFAVLAARNGMTINSFDAARLSPIGDKLYCTTMPEKLLRDGPEADSAYVLSDIMAARLVDHHDITHYCRQVDGFNLCTFDPAHSAQSHLLGQQILPGYTLGTEFHAEQKSPKSILVENLDTLPAYCRWTIGREAYVYLRPVSFPTSDLLLDMEFGNDGALLTKQHRRQSANLKINGQAIGTIKLVLGGSNANRRLIIPHGFLRDGEVNTVTFELPDAIAPRDLGINEDGRLLGLCIRRLRIVGPN